MICFGAADNHFTHCFLTEGFFTLLFANSSSLCFKFFALNQKALFFFFSFPKAKILQPKMEAFCRGCAARETCGSCSPSAVFPAQHGSAPGHRVTPTPVGAPTLPFTQEQRCSSPAVSPVCSQQTLFPAPWTWLGGGGRARPFTNFQRPLSRGHRMMAQGDGTWLSCGSRGSLGSTGTSPRRVPISRQGHMAHCRAPKSGAFP